MKLIKIEINGFKSFADKTILNFDGGVVGIVGPNGSGKSNINDAIKWVLGEQSSKSLRGDSMEDVIFAGSKTTKSLDRAEVILTFDNQLNPISLPDKFFTISRVLNRGKGSNEYYINGEIARQRDIKEIAMESGISKSSLAIISQGTISTIAEASVEDRRKILEEAAGTSKYKMKKVETLKKLDKTEEALEKINAVLNELNKQLLPLQRQADKAKAYLEKTEKLKDIEIGLLTEDTIIYNEELKSTNDKIAHLEQQQALLNNQIDSINLNYEQTIKFKQSLEKEQDKLQTDLNEINEKLSILEIQKAKDEQRKTMILNGEIQVSAQDRIAILKEDIKKYSELIEYYEKFDNENNQKLVNYLTNNQNLEQQISNLRQQQIYLNSSIEKSKSRILFLQETKDKKTNLYKGTRLILENQNLFKGYKGLVSDLIKFEDKYALAIETILNKATQHIVFDKSDSVIKAVDFLKNNRLGRATFIPLASIKPKGIRVEHLNFLKSHADFIGVASDLVMTKNEFQILNLFLLGNIIITRNIEGANKISNMLEHRYMVVTLDGDIIRAGGVITGGQTQELDTNSNIDKQIAELENLLPSLEEENKKAKLKIAELENKLSASWTDISEIKVLISQNKDKKSLAYARFTEFKNLYQEATNESIVLDDNSLDKNNTDSIEILETRKNVIVSQMTSKKEQINLLNNDHTNLLLTKNKTDNDLRNINSSLSKENNIKNKLILSLEATATRLVQQYGIVVESAEQYNKLNIDRDSAREIVEKLKKEIVALGNVNLDALEDIKQVEERYADIKANQEELIEAKNIIMNAIADMDQIIINKLDETVNLVNEEFSNVFQKMFGGGFAKVQYTMPDNLIETGIDIIAQPPGKSIKNLKLFSGGEKALIAISLLFAILKAKPIPLCILDEVEAALDETNVIRYAEFLQKLKPVTQFIVITHRQGTMARVDHLFGATMQKRGVTSIFNIELSETKKLIEQKN